jgi:DNA mismatch endonuclease (patch repair protein)
MDKVSPQTRSRMMAGIRGRETKPERIVRTALFARGFRYRKNCPDLPGKPDIKLTKYHAVILVHGCFWHGHNCRYYRVPASNSEFWARKVDANRIRDARDITALRVAGWRVCIVWECVTRNTAFKDYRLTIIDTLAGWITGNEPFLELYDQEAMLKDSGTSRHEIYTMGINSEIDRFAAEHSICHESRNSEQACPLPGTFTDTNSSLDCTDQSWRPPS